LQKFLLCEHENDANRKPTKQRSRNGMNDLEDEDGGLRYHDLELVGEVDELANYENDEVEGQTPAKAQSPDAEALVNDEEHDDEGDMDQ
jgi:hypothetical protein